MADHEIRIEGFAYKPAQLIIQPGDTVTWINLDPGMAHTATSAEGAAHAFDTGDLPLGDYLCVLQAQIDDHWHDLASDRFSLIEPPVRVDARFVPASTGRVLVLLDASAATADADPHGPAGAPDLAQQREYLLSLLDGAGWSHTAVESAEAFADELRSGAFDLYALLSEQVKLDNVTQKLLREAVHRGEGLLEAGRHDQRNNGFDESLGVRFRGKLSGADGIELLASPLHREGQLNLVLADKPLRLELDGAESAGCVLRNGRCRGDPALAYFRYGVGQSVVAAHDLLAEAALSGHPDIVGEVMLGALGWALPRPYDDNRPRADRPHGLAIELDNLGIATGGRLRLFLPAGVTVLDAGDGELVDGSWQAAFDLAQGETRRLQLWIRLPADTAPLTVEAEVQSGDAGSYRDQARIEMQLAPERSDGFDSLRSQLPAGQPFKLARKALDKAVAHYLDGDVDKAQQQLLECADRLIDVGGNEADRYRLMVGEALREVWR